jgi:hypothetical protein
MIASGRWRDQEPHDPRTIGTTAHHSSFRLAPLPPSGPAACGRCSWHGGELAARSWQCLRVVLRYSVARVGLGTAAGPRP